MRIVSVEVQRWRNLRGVAIVVPAEARLVCLVGENGSGKSTVLELISYAAHHLGLSTGVDSPRGDPSQEDHDFTLVAVVPEGIAELARFDAQPDGSLAWDGTVQFRSDRSGVVVRALGVDGQFSETLARASINRMRQRQETQHLYLDADRAYPPMQLQAHQYQEILSQDWQSPEFSRQWSFRTTKTLYEEWHKYFIATEEKVATGHLAEIRRSRQTGSEPPEFVDPFDAFRASVKQVLPHLDFIGVEPSGVSRTILFNSTALDIPFSKLSGGEREIAFLIGQIERFGLRNGLLLIDEPELHLNPDLLRTWVAFLRDTVLDGQVWLATHSLEAVEVAGPDASFVFEKDPSNRITTSVTLLGDRPVISALSASIGAPAFSLSRLRFVFVEGDRQSRERERFFDVCGDAGTNRFIEGGSCHEVIRRLQHVRELAAETGEQLHVGGVVDRDFRTDDEVATLLAEGGVYVLECHEIENLFIDPSALGVLAERAGVELDIADAVREESDGLAGLWVAQRAASRIDGAIPKSALTIWSALGWSVLDGTFEHALAQSQVYFDDGGAQEWEGQLRSAGDAYRAIRVQPDLWLHCMGKQVCSRMASRLGYRSAGILQNSVVQLWRDGAAPEPIALVSLRAYLESLNA